MGADASQTHGLVREHLELCRKVADHPARSAYQVADLAAVQDRETIYVFALHRDLTATNINHADARGDLIGYVHIDDLPSLLNRNKSRWT